MGTNILGRCIPKRSSLRGKTSCISGRGYHRGSRKELDRKEVVAKGAVTTPTGVVATGITAGNVMA